MKDLLVYVLIALVMVLLADTVARHVRAVYRREVVQQRTLVHLQRTLDGVIEQVDQQASEIERLETALQDAHK